jgi:periplasmic protein TonB
VVTLIDDSSGGREPKSPDLSVRLNFLLGSVIVHLLLIMAMILAPERPPTRLPVVAAPEAPQKQTRVFLPPKELLRAARPLPRAVPTPVPTPPPAADRMSIGGPGPQRKDRLLHRDEDLTRQARGRPDAVPSAAPPAAAGPPATPAPVQEARQAQAASQDRLRFPAGPGAAQDARVPAPVRSAQPPSLAATLRDLDARLAREGARGIASGTGQQMGALFFDPEGADFTVWANHWKNETYRNWIVPASVQFGQKGRVDLSFTVERDGRVSDVTLVKSSGTAALDRAAANALLSGRLLPLPADYTKPRITIGVSFFYNMNPQEQ